jgi:hypothetical protein
MVLAPPHATTSVGRVADLSARTVGSYLLTCKYSAAPMTPQFQIKGVFLTESTNPSDSLISACSVAGRWLLEKLNAFNDLPSRSENITGRELARHTRRTACAVRTYHQAMASQHDLTPLPLELTSCYQEVRMDIPTSCTVVGMLYHLFTTT